VPPHAPLGPHHSAPGPPQDHPPVHGAKRRVTAGGPAAAAQCGGLWRVSLGKGFGSGGAASRESPPAPLPPLHLPPHCSLLAAIATAAPHPTPFMISVGSRRSLGGRYSVHMTFFSSVHLSLPELFLPLTTFDQLLSPTVQAFCTAVVPICAAIHMLHIANESFWKKNFSHAQPSSMCAGLSASPQHPRMPLRSFRAGAACRRGGSVPGAAEKT
jgi:hypothetical protein